MLPGEIGLGLGLRLGFGGVAHEQLELADLEAQRFLHVLVAAAGGDQIIAQQGILLPDAVGPVLSLGMDGGTPVQLPEHHAGGPLQIEPAGRPEGNDA